MRITDFEKLIQQMPVEHQSFDIKYAIWKNTAQDQLVKQIFGENQKDGVITISRSDLKGAYWNLEEFVIKVLMWGFPTKGMGQNIDNFLEPGNFSSFIQELKDFEKRNIFDMHEIKRLLKFKGLKFSSLSKILYFMNIKVEKYSALILDLRVIKALNSGRFEDSDIEIFKNLRWDNAVENYVNYLDFMDYLSRQMNTEPDKIEMFLFEFGSNLKEMVGEEGDFSLL